MMPRLRPSDMDRYDHYVIARFVDNAMDLAFTLGKYFVGYHFLFRPIWANHIGPFLWACYDVWKKGAV